MRTEGGGFGVRFATVWAGLGGQVLLKLWGGDVEADQLPLTADFFQTHLKGGLAFFEFGRVGNIGECSGIHLTNTELPARF